MSKYTLYVVMPAKAGIHQFLSPVDPGFRRDDGYLLHSCQFYKYAGWPMTDRDHIQRRCPRLGGPVSFGYCRTIGEDKGPCFKVLDCWWEQFDVVGFFKHELPKDKFEKLQSAPPPNKVASLVDLIRQAKERAKGT